MSFGDLPPDILFAILTRLDSQELRCTVPLVCKAWRDACSPPSSLWHSIDVDVSQQAIILASARRFFQQRASQLKSLRLLCSPEEPNFAALVLTALGNEAPLRRICVDFGGAALACTVSFLAQLGWMKQVRALGISGIKGQMTTGHLQSLGHMRHLKAIKLVFTETSFPALPDGFPAALFSCTRLERLHIANAGTFAFRVIPEGIGRLTNLREIKFEACGVYGFHNHLSKLTNLESLTVVSSSCPRRIRFGQSLSELEKLSSVDLACREIPIELGRLPALKHLKLRGLRPSNRGSHDPEEDFETLLSQVQLQSLGIYSSALDTLPQAVTCQSSLLHLSLCNCSLSDLPPGPYLLNLQHLDLSDNNFVDFPSVVLSAPLLQSLKGFGQQTGSHKPSSFES